MKSREGSFEDGYSQELSPRNTSPEQLRARIEALEGELALSVARGEGPADAKQAVPEQTELRARLKQVDEDLGAAVGREEYLEAARLQAELAPLREQERLLSELVKKQARLAELTGELDAALELASRIKARKAVEARANAKNELHKAMFAVADILGGAYSQLRDPSGDVRFEAKDPGLWAAGAGACSRMHAHMPPYPPSPAPRPCVTPHHVGSAGRRALHVRRR